MDDIFSHTFDQNDIDVLFSSQAEESINLEFKRGDALDTGEHSKKEIAKDVSAFANSDGGLIIYGIEEHNHKASRLVFVNGNEVSKEWIEQIINSRIQRKIEGLIIEPVRYYQKIEQTIYVVKIPRSLNAPHMTSEKRFYKRYNFQSVEMEEYEIRNLYNRQDKTHLEIDEPKINGASRSSHAQRLDQYSLNIQIDVTNKGQTIEKLYKVEVHSPRNATDATKGYGAPPKIFSHLARYEGDHAIFTIPNSSPLFQQERATIGIVPLLVTAQNFIEINSIPFIIKLYYSSGTDEKSIILIDHFEYKGRKLTLTDFNGQ
jgi:hypothetical protein